MSKQYPAPVRQYLVRLAELAGAGFVAGAGEHVLAHGLELSQASLKGLVVAGLLAAYGVIVKKLGDKGSPLAK